MVEQNSVFKVNISTQKLLGGIGSIFVLLNFIPGIGTILGILGAVFLLISVYQISSRTKKLEIFNKFLIGFILSVIGWIIALMFGLMSFVSLFASSVFMGDEVMAGLGIGVGVFIGLLSAYVILIIAYYFHKKAYEILALVTNHKLFRKAGLFMYVGAITVILFGIGLIMLLIGWIILAVAFFTAPDEIEIGA